MCVLGHVCRRARDSPPGAGRGPGTSATATRAPTKLEGRGAGRRTYVASCPRVFSSEIRPRRSSGDGPISGVQPWRIPELAGDQKELSVGTPTSSSTVTAVSGSGGPPLRSDRRNSTMENLDGPEKL
ncbi:hypothetical protein EVAR_53709_1 [Eumeta japonica]|uniref:Uncharacterized protein n=1 Tax=Eumeta variegata TaxID=151549 RepID=A0A4C1Z3W8_EUMVA|nr:hypothetical protein EVAR_53709_1 [Eumeta japonica]